MSGYSPAFLSFPFSYTLFRHPPEGRTNFKRTMFTLWPFQALKAALPWGNPCFIFPAKIKLFKALKQCHWQTEGRKGTRQNLSFLRASKMAIYFISLKEKELALKSLLPLVEICFSISHQADQLNSYLWIIPPPFTPVPQISLLPHQDCYLHTA